MSSSDWKHSPPRNRRSPSAWRVYASLSNGSWQVSRVGAPVKRASARVKVPSVQLDGSAPQTVPTASPRGGVESRHGFELAGRNEHMNHTNEPRKTTPGSRAPQLWAKAAESEPRPTVEGSDNGPAGSAWTIPHAGRSDTWVSGETCHGE